MGVCTSKRLTAMSVQPTTVTTSFAKHHPEPCLVVDSKRQTVPILGPIAASPLAVRRAKLMKKEGSDVASPTRVDETQSVVL